MSFRIPEGVRNLSDRQAERFLVLLEMTKVRSMNLMVLLVAVCGGGLTLAAIGVGLYFFLKDREE
jgi:hypothetical protein